MLVERKTIKDPEGKPSASYGAGTQDMSVMSYHKTRKLITALYMVTDIMDSAEPIRNKLRTLGVEILSDTISTKKSNFSKNIQEIFSLLDIAFTMQMISEMNKNILVNEFTQLKNSILTIQDNPAWLEEFLKEPLLDSPHPNPLLAKEKGNSSYKGHTRIGVQKASTLMQALSDKNLTLNTASHAEGFQILKKERRDVIIDSIKKNGGSATITDIRNKSKGHVVSFSEKTLQRELISMVKDRVLKKTGEKRWTRYSLLVS